jgi:hypothetical protein
MANGQEQDQEKTNSRQNELKTRQTQDKTNSRQTQDKRRRTQDKKNSRQDKLKTNSRQEIQDKLTKRQSHDKTTLNKKTNPKLFHLPVLSTLTCFTDVKQDKTSSNPFNLDKD